MKTNRVYKLSAGFIAALCFSLIGAAQLWAESTKAPVQSEIYSKGPQGGKLFRDGEFSLEITIFESGMPPEMRVFSYLNDELVTPKSVQLIVTLHRLPQRVDELTFTPESDYLVSKQIVTEPHSFDVVINARHEGKTYQWKFPSYEGRSVVSDRILKLSEISLGRTGPRELEFSRSLFGVVAIPNQAKSDVYASYPSIVKKVHVKVGDKVKAKQVLVSLVNSKTLQRYTIKSAIDGEVVRWDVNPGARVDTESFGMVANLSQVWVELSAFPEDIEELAIGQKVIVNNLHGDKTATGSLNYIAPIMTGGHIARARVNIDNVSGNWRPGMHAKAKVMTKTKKVALAVDKRALQNFRGNDVVFAKFGNTFEVRMLELGESNDKFIEVLSGIESGVEYATNNSFLIKADVLKDGASHDH